MKPVSCRESRLAIDLVGDMDRLPPEVARHVAGCRACESFGLELLALRRLIREPERVTVPSDFDARLAARLRQSRKQALAAAVPPWRREFGLKFAMAAAAVALLTGGGAMYLLEPGAPVADNAPAPTAAVIRTPGAVATPPAAATTAVVVDVPAVRNAGGIRRVSTTTRTPRASQAMIFVRDGGGSRVVAVPEVLVGAEEILPADINEGLAMAGGTTGF
jgi:hypothetical protein